MHVTHGYAGTRLYHNVLCSNPACQASQAMEDVRAKDRAVISPCSTRSSRSRRRRSSPSGRNSCNGGSSSLMVTGRPSMALKMPAKSSRWKGRISSRAFWRASSVWGGWGGVRRGRMWLAGRLCQAGNAARGLLKQSVA